MQPTAEQFTEKAWAAIIEAQNLAQTFPDQSVFFDMHLFPKNFHL